MAKMYLNIVFGSQDVGYSAGAIENGLSLLVRRKTRGLNISIKNLVLKCRLKAIAKWLNIHLTILRLKV
jgi:hypothetical protein